MDLSLALFLACIDATLPHPHTLPQIVGKALGIVLAAAIVCAHVIIVSPYIPAQDWKRPVRALLLILAAACAIMNALASAVDAGLGGTRVFSAIEYGSYVLIAIFALTLIALVLGIGRAMYLGARWEIVIKDGVKLQGRQPMIESPAVNPSDGCIIAQTENPMRSPSSSSNTLSGQQRPSFRGVLQVNDNPLHSLSMNSAALNAILAAQRSGGTRDGVARVGMGISAVRGSAGKRRASSAIQEAASTKV